ncbi:MAG: flagellar basal body rod protein FlgC [Phycisphaerae bacterium]
MIGALDISHSAVVAQRTRLDVIAGNLANAFTTRQQDGTIEPYRRRFVTLASQSLGGDSVGVRVTGVQADEADFPLRHNPGSPDAIREGPNAGYVRYPNVNVTLEYVDALEASRAYEANVAMMGVTRGMIQSALRLFA